MGGGGPEGQGAGDPGDPGADPPEQADGEEGGVPSGEGGGARSAEVWRAVGAGLSGAGLAVGRLASAVGRGAQAALQTVDPDVLRHLAQLPLVGLTLLAPGRPPVRALPDDGHRPVVFVHGLGGGPGNFLAMRGWFRVMGRGRTWSVGFGEGGGALDLAQALREYLAEVALACGLAEGQKLDLVAHSMGGLVCRLALSDPATAARVERLVTLGTPHAGTHAARYANTRLARELRPDSELMEVLGRQVPWPGPPAMPRLTSFYSPADMMILPPEAARVEGARNVEVPGFTHFTWLFHPRGWQAVLTELEREEEG
ncbi:alpha/beta fold hydrolase [Myxococcota bacterium]|nr:alpha/beta fold hydrolase [Myxococcota bacterium]